MIDIPGDRLSIRFFVGGMDCRAGIWFFDFYNRLERSAVDAPPGYAVTIVAPAGLAGAIQSIEQVSTGEGAKPGFEKFAVVESVQCSLARHGKHPFLFQIPSRTSLDNQFA
ncbi:hypothetical protein DFH08DRAFT_691609 [Mycena albidolilacea]|uniref:Uncharacterized protein n=1 Tax=Mycena albidolilacea TaxID=1033008 RepID=A0AAD7ABQ3_9AGAR|nr:hypothetical protein DFH08DRAFT_691609 [Mycena albidolilacea]